MEALAKASHNPDEIILGEDDEDDEQEIEGNGCPTNLYTPSYAPHKGLYTYWSGNLQMADTENVYL